MREFHRVGTGPRDGFKHAGPQNLHYKTKEHFKNTAMKGCDLTKNSWLVAVPLSSYNYPLLERGGGREREEKYTTAEQYVWQGEGKVLRNIFKA